MIETVVTLNNFAHDGKDDVQQADDHVYILTSDQLRAIISDAVQKATESILSHVSELKARINALEAKSTVIEAQVESDLNHLANGLAEDRKRLSALEQHPRTTALPPGTKTTARIAHIKTILKDRGATTFKELCRILDISAREMSRITKRLDMRFYEITRRPGDARQKVLRLRSQIG